jgi:hypothetical protein
MREDPGLDKSKISSCLEAHYGLRAASVAFLPVGYDPNAAAYEVVSREGEAYFLKVRLGQVDWSRLAVPRALADLGVGNVLTPLRALSSELWCPLDGYPGYGVVLYRSSTARARWSSGSPTTSGGSSAPRCGPCMTAGSEGTSAAGSRPRPSRCRRQLWCGSY